MENGQIKIIFEYELFDYFTEISFSPETSILLQIIRIIHMTVWIIPESDREEGSSLSVLAPRWQTTMRLPQTKTLSGESPLGDLRTPPFLGRKEGTLSSPKNSLKKKHQPRESNLARRKRSQRYSPLPPVAPSCVGCQPGGIDL